MKRTGILVVLLLAPALAGAEPGKVEITILGGGSLLEVRQTSVTPPCLECVVPLGAGQVLPVPLPPIRFSESRSLGRGVLIGFRVGYDLSDRAEIEAGFAVEPSRTLRSDFAIGCPAGRPCPFLVRRPEAEKVAGYDYDAAFLFHLTRARVRPFLTAGIGGMSFDAPDRTRTNFAFRYGAGLKVGVGRMGVRVDVVDALVFDHFLTGRAEHDLRVRGGVSFRP